MRVPVLLVLPVRACARTCVCNMRVCLRGAGLVTAIRSFPKYSRRLEFAELIRDRGIRAIRWTATIKISRRKIARLSYEIGTWFVLLVCVVLIPVFTLVRTFPYVLRLPCVLSGLKRKKGEDQSTVFSSRGCNAMYLFTTLHPRISVTNLNRAFSVERLIDLSDRRNEDNRKKRITISFVSQFILCVKRSGVRIVQCLTQLGALRSFRKWHAIILMKVNNHFFRCWIKRYICNYLWPFISSIYIYIKTNVSFCCLYAFTFGTFISFVQILKFKNSIRRIV